MSHARTPILVGVVSLVSEILVLSKRAKFPFRPMDYSPWSSKKLVNRNWPQKIKQVGIDVKCTHIKFDGRGFSSFGDIGTLKTAKFPFRTMDYNSPWSSKNSIDRNRLKKFRQMGVDVTYMHTNFGGRDLSGFRDIATFKNGQISLSTHGL